MGERHRYHSSSHQIAERKAAGMRRAVMGGGLAVGGIAVLAYTLRQLGASLDERDSLTPIEAFYKEMANRDAKDAFSFKTGISRNTINIINFSQAEIDRTAAKTALDFWEKTGYTKSQVKYSSDSDTTIEGIITPEGLGVESFIFIVDPDSPDPFWNSAGQPAVTVRAENSNRRVNLTLIRLEPLQGDEAQLFVSNSVKANSEFYTEACQTSIIVQTSMPNNHLMAQEIFCNTVSDVITAHFLGRDYPDYSEVVRKFKFTFPALGQEANVDPVSKEIFDQIKALDLPPVIIQN